MKKKRRRFGKRKMTIFEAVFWFCIVGAVMFIFSNLFTQVGICLIIALVALLVDIGLKRKKSKRVVN